MSRSTLDLGAYALPGRVLDPRPGLEQASTGEALGLGSIWVAERWGKKGNCSHPWGTDTANFAGKVGRRHDTLWHSSSHRPCRHGIDAAGTVRQPLRARLWPLGSFHLEEPGHFGPGECGHGGLCKDFPVVMGRRDRQLRRSGGTLPEHAISSQASASS